MSGRTEQTDWAIQLKEIACLDMRMRGASYRDMVAVGLYKSASSARESVLRALRRYHQEPSEAVRAMEVARLDALTQAHWANAISGDIPSTRIVIELSVRRCRILGIDAPTKIDIVGMLTALAESAGVSPEDAISEGRNLLNQYQGHAEA